MKLRALLPLVALAGLTMPAFAASADVALLQKFAGTWTGGGQMSGGEDGNVECRLSLTPNGEKLTFNGRCSLVGEGAQSFQGVIGYNDQAKRFEARSTNGLVVGKKSGSTLTFAFEGKNIRGAVNSTMQLSPNAIRVDFKLTDSRTKAVSQSSIPFKRS